jgi:hypothetical protein
MIFEIVMLILAVGLITFCIYMQNGPPRSRTSPQQLARYRRGTFFIAAWGIIFVVRILTHTYK